MSATNAAALAGRIIVVSLVLSVALLHSSLTPASAQDATFRISPTVRPGVAQEIQVLVQQSLEFLRSELGTGLSQPVTVFVFGSQREVFEGFITELGYSEESARRAAARGSFFAVGHRIIINGSTPLFTDPPWRVNRASLIGHEMAHVFHNDLMGGSRPAHTWIREGFATRMEVRMLEHLNLNATRQTANINLTLFALRRGELIPLSELETGERWNTQIERVGSDRVYAQAYVAVDLLIRTRGTDAMLKYFRAFRGQQDAAANFMGAFGQSVEAFQRELEDYLTRGAR